MSNPQANTSISASAARKIRFWLPAARNEYFRIYDLNGFRLTLIVHILDWMFAILAFFSLFCLHPLWMSSDHLAATSPNQSRAPQIIFRLLPKTKVISNMWIEYELLEPYTAWNGAKTYFLQSSNRPNSAIHPFISFHSVAQIWPSMITNWSSTTY